MECDDLSRRSKGFPFLPLKTNGCLIFKSGPSRFPGFGDRVSQGLPACGLHGRLAWGLGYILLVQLILLNVPLAG